jgi:hypothetical protein
MNDIIERLRAEYQVQRQNRTCRECQKPLHQGHGQPRLTCIEREDERRIRMNRMIPDRAAWVASS